MPKLSLLTYQKVQYAWSVTLVELRTRMYTSVQRDVQMKTVTFTEFRKNASELFSDVEHGEVLVIVRASVECRTLCLLG